MQFSNKLKTNMKHFLIKFILVILILKFSNCFCQEKINFFDSDELKIDTKFIDPTKGYFGIDYNFDVSKKILNSVSSNLNEIELSIKAGSKGFLTVVGENNMNNSLISEIKFDGYFPTSSKKSSVEDWKDALKQTDLEKRSSILAKRLESPLWIFTNLHAKHEAVQDFKSYDFAFGIELGMTSSLLSKIFDIPFGLFRNGKNNNPRQLDISIGYDYVTGLNKTKIASLKDSSDYMHRLNIKSEWETGFLNDDNRLLFSLNTYYDLNATQKMKNDNKDWNIFYMIKLDHLLWSNTNQKSLVDIKFTIKYTHGELPPNFEKGYVLGGGFSVDF